MTFASNNRVILNCCVAHTLNMTPHADWMVIMQCVLAERLLQSDHLGLTCDELLLLKLVRLRRNQLRTVESIKSIKAVLVGDRIPKTRGNDFEMGNVILLLLSFRLPLSHI